MIGMNFGYTEFFMWISLIALFVLHGKGAWPQSNAIRTIQTRAVAKSASIKIDEQMIVPSDESIWISNDINEVKMKFSYCPVCQTNRTPWRGGYFFFPQTLILPEQTQHWRDGSCFKLLIVHYLAKWLKDISPAFLNSSNEPKWGTALRLILSRWYREWKLLLARRKEIL